MLIIFNFYLYHFLSDYYFLLIFFYMFNLTNQIVYFVHIEFYFIVLDTLKFPVVTYVFHLIIIFIPILILISHHNFLMYLLLNHYFY